ncbi:MAG: iron export ABC transporter permease subunit FetB [Cyanobacteriota bacterium]|nr:iron export ABC transporter permease subunit FetB [Cyanobacteriota bacterium]
MLIPLDFTDLTLALGLIAIAIALSFWQQLGLEWQFLLATVRSIVQLAVVGYVLAIILDPLQPNPALIVGFGLLMLTLVTVVTRNRISRKIPQLLYWVWFSLGVSALLIVGYVQTLVIQPTPLYSPQYLIPLLAAVLGNAMNAASVAGERLVTTLNRSQIEIETHLSLGATPQQALKSYRQEAIQAGLVPTLNSLAIVGIVTIPGILTGQLLVGVDPLDAVSYQILILLTIAVANLIATLVLSVGICRQYFSPEAQFQHF